MSSCCLLEYIHSHDVSQHTRTPDISQMTLPSLLLSSDYGSPEQSGSRVRDAGSQCCICGKNKGIYRARVRGKSKDKITSNNHLVS